MKLFLLFSFSLLVALANGQKIDNTSSFRDIQSESYIRMNYENDLFASQDKNYTQGYSFDLVLPILSKNPINYLFLHLKDDKRKAGIAFEHIGFTPKNYDELQIQQGDRPFAAVAMLKSFSISVNEASKQRIASHLSVGILGPAALGKEIQTGIHQLTGDLIPYGWSNQIENSFVLNYGIDYEKELLRIKDNFGLYANASGKIGNLYTNATVGFNTRFGLINNPYQFADLKPFLLYAYIQPLLTVVAYDGSLLGGILDDRSVYTVPKSEVNKLVGQLNYGIIMQFKSFYIEYSGTNITKEIKTLTPAAWGGIKLGYKLR